MARTERRYNKGARSRGKSTDRQVVDTGPATTGERVRINRYIARAGICSRRDADVLIEQGDVVLNGEVVTQLGITVGTSDEVIVKGKRIKPAGLQYVLLNKPTDTITTVSDEKGRKTVMDLVAPERFKDAGLFPVGRLDRHTCGVLLVTNDGMLTHRLTHPKFEVEKIYRVRAKKPISDDQIATLRNGVELEDGPARVDRIERLDDEKRQEVGISIHEGRNRQIRRMFEAIGSEVDQLERVRYAGLTTNGLRRGRWRMLTEREIARLYRTVKL